MNNTLKAPLDTLASIRTRRTIKVLSDTPLPTTACDEEFIQTLIESAYYAPNHYPCPNEHKQHLSSPLPWRFYVLDSSGCRRLAQKLPELTDAPGKLLPMLNSADYLLLATWCPQTKKQEDEKTLFDASLVNMEHIAAAGAAIQNLLLTATALGQENYWGSGGCLRGAEAYKMLGIPTAEILLGSLFLFPDADESTGEQIKFATSNRREQRGNVKDSYRIIRQD